MPGRDRQHRRLIRTIVLGSIAVFAAIAWVADEIGMDKQELLDFALTGLGLVLGMVVLAVVGAALLRGLKWLMRRGS